MPYSYQAFRGASSGSAVSLRQNGADAFLWRRDAILPKENDASVANRSPLLLIVLKMAEAWIGSTTEA